MKTRSSVLGKRAHQHQDSSSTTRVTRSCGQLQTPDSTPNPKRARTSLTLIDGESNKENVPPFSPDLVNESSPTSPSGSRSLRRTTTEIITPTRNRLGRRSASFSPSTPVTEISELAITTPPPTPPNALLPVHARARALLRSTCNNANSEIAGRDAERAAIRDFLLPFIDHASIPDGTSSSSMYISGSPGTGKTALVNSIIQSLKIEHAHIKVISLNCMSLKSVDVLWERLIEELGNLPERKSSGKTKKSKESVESILAGLCTKCIVILDELDHITPNSQSLANLFSLLDATPSTLRLIGIANTHTLTSASTSAAFSSSSSVQTLHFAPYTPAQLLQILQSRLTALFKPSDELVAQEGDAKKFLPTTTLMLLTKKIAALTGDVRSLFEVLRGAIDIAVTTPVKSSEDANPLNTPSTSVTPSHILAALKAYTPSSAKPIATSAPSLSTGNSEIITKVRNLTIQARLVLVSLLQASKRREAGLTLSSSVQASPKKPSPIKRTASLPISSPGLGAGIDTAQLYTYYSGVLTRGDMGIFDPISRSEFADLLGLLESSGLVALSSSLTSSPSATRGKRAFARSASFGTGTSKAGAGTVGEVRLAEGVWGDEVLRGLGVSGTSVEGAKTDVIEEEVKAIWERERQRLSRDVKALASMNKTSSDTFAGAFES